MNTKFSSLKIAISEEDEKCTVITRRLSERRCCTRRNSKPKLFSHRDVFKLRNTSYVKNLLMIRIHERRQQNRRTSKPKMLSVDEIISLRK